MGQMGRAAMEDLILKCSADIPRQSLQHKGIGTMLRRRLSIELRVDLFNFNDEETGNFLSKLGNAKYHLFTPGVKFNKRKSVRRRDFLKGEARVAERIESSVKDFLDEDLGWNVDSAVEAWLCNGSVAETESFCSDAAVGSEPEEEC